MFEIAKCYKILHTYHMESNIDFHRMFFLCLFSPLYLDSNRSVPNNPPVNMSTSKVNFLSFSLKSLLFQPKWRGMFTYQKRCLAYKKTVIDTGGSNRCKSMFCHVFSRSKKNLLDMHNIQNIFARERTTIN